MIAFTLGKFGVDLFVKSADVPMLSKYLQNGSARAGDFAGISRRKHSRAIKFPDRDALAGNCRGFFHDSKITLATPSSKPMR